MRESMRAGVEQEWDAFVAAHPQGTLLQTSRWGRLKGAFGWQWEIVTHAAGIQFDSGALVLYKSLPFRLGNIAYVPRGPLTDWDKPELARATLDALLQAARRRGSWALWIEPPIEDTETARHLLAGLSLRPASHTIQPPRTIVIDITGPEEAILARMKSKTRYNIRLAQRKGVRVREGSLADIPAFHALMVETGERDEFGVHSEPYYHEALRLFSEVRQVALLLAEVEDELVAGIMAFALGRQAWYLIGASSNAHRNSMPTYLLQWEAIRWARAQGCETYDLWGIPDADEEVLEANFTERQDGLWGVYRFKRGFGGSVTRYVAMWERSLHPLYPLAIRLRRSSVERA